MHGELSKHPWCGPFFPRHNQPFTPPAGAHCNIHPHEGAGWAGKEKVNERLPSPGLGRVRLELPGASRNPRGHQPATTGWVRSCVLPSTTGWVRWPCRLANWYDARYTQSSVLRNTETASTHQSVSYLNAFPRCDPSMPRRPCCQFPGEMPEIIRYRIVFPGSWLASGFGPLFRGPWFVDILLEKRHNLRL
jgi:hypothetical protein